MASDNRIKFSIFSEFQDEGMKKANQAVTSLGKEAKKAGGILTGVTSALGGMSGPAGQAASSISTLVTGFASMGLIGGVIAGLKMAFDAYVEWQKKKIEEMFKAAENRINQFANRAKQLMGQLNTAQKNNSAQNSINSAFNASKQAEDANKIAKLKVDQLQRQIDLVTGGFKEVEASAKKVVDAQNRAEIANKEYELAQTRNAELVRQASENQKNAEDRVKIATAAKIAAEEAHTKAIAEWKASTDENKEQLKKVVTDTQTQMEKAREAEVDAKNEKILADIAYKTAVEKAEADNTNAEIKKIEATNAVTEALEEKNKAYRDATKAQADAEKKLKEATEKAAKEAEEKARAESDKQTREQRDRRVKEAENEGQARLDDLKRQYQNAKTLQEKAQAELDYLSELDKLYSRGMQADHANHNGISGGGYKYATDEDGNVYRQQDMERLGRYNKRKDRDEQNKLNGQRKDYEKADQRLQDARDELKDLGEYRDGELNETTKRRNKLKDQIKDMEDAQKNRPENRKQAEAEKKKADDEVKRIDDAMKQAVIDTKNYVEQIKDAFNTMTGN